MAKYRLNHEVVVDGAVELVNQRGADSLSLAELAARFRIRTPSLYNHIDGLDGLRRDLALRGMILLTDQIRPAIAGLSGHDALLAAAHAYRNFALANAGLYPYLLRTVAPDDVELCSAMKTLDELLAATLRGYRIAGDDVQHAVRFTRAVLHGFASQELAGAFAAPPELDASYHLAIEGMDRALRGIGKKSGGDSA